MAEYRAYFVGDDDHFKSVRVLNCPDDATAIAKAKQFLDVADIEIWQRGRMVARLSRNEK